MIFDAIYLQPESEGVEQCVIFDVVGGPKRYMRLWPNRPGRDGTGKLVEWGWVLGDTAIEIWHR